MCILWTHLVGLTNRSPHATVTLFFSCFFCFFPQELDDHLCTSLCSNRVEAEVIVHSELSDPGREKEEEGSDRDSSTTRGPSLSDDTYSPLSRPSSPGEEQPLEKCPLAGSPTGTPLKTLAVNRKGEVDGTGQQTTADAVPQQDTGLTNGFHSPKAVRSVLTSEREENEEPRLCPSAPGKATSAGLSPAPFVNSGFVHSTSAAHTYLCP